MMKTVKMQGGLGNQLFCFALAHSIAALTGEPVALDLAAYESDRYGAGFVLQPLARSVEFTLTRHPWLGSRSATAALRLLAPPGYVSERSASVDPAALAQLLRKGRYFNGYWQNEAFIADPVGLKRQIRAFLLERTGEATAYPLVVHCRTYKEEIHQRRRAGPDETFFRRALAFLQVEDLAPDQIVLISDDPALALGRLGALGGRVSVLPSQGAWSDMALMLRADRLILSNSSFSWWGGFCGDARAMIYPARDGLFHYPNPAGAFTVI